VVLEIQGSRASLFLYPILYLTISLYFVTIANMLKIRLQRVGRKSEPTYRLVLTDSKNSTKSGRYLEILGNYDSRRGEKAVIKADRVTYWMSKGAQVSGTVHNMLVTTKVISGKKINVLSKKKPIMKEGAEAPAAAADSTATEAAPVETPAEATPDEAPAEATETAEVTG